MSTDAVTGEFRIRQDYSRDTDGNRRSTAVGRPHRNAVPCVISAGFSKYIKGYEVLGVLGKGAYGMVYLAKCRHNNMEIAIKMINKELMHYAKMEDRVTAEIKIHTQLKHPTILEAYTWFEDDHYVYLVLELCDNGDLLHYLQAHGTLSEEEAAYIIKQVVQGLLHLRFHNIVHRDLSLSNVLLTKNMQVKIADFGLATQSTKPDEKHLTMCGTPNFISPEIAIRSPHGPEADVWSLGCMLYTLLVGKPPFETNGVKGTLTRVVMDDYEIPSHLSDNAKDLIDKLLKKNPKDRIHLSDIDKHPFIEKNRLRNERNGASKIQFTNGMMDSGLGRTLSSCGHQPKIRSQSEERKSVKKIPMISVRSEPLSNSVVKMISNHSAKYNCRPKEDSLSIPLPRDRAFSQSEQYSNYNAYNSKKPKIVEKPKKENVENRSAERTQKNTKLSVSPLNSNRLQPTRHTTKNVILTILNNGEVCLEFLKRRNSTKQISEVCRISGDGQRIILYKPTTTVEIGSQPLPLPSGGADNMYSYENLPSYHHQKYMYASRFVKLVQAKTPKLTLYTQSSKCLFMENGPDPDCEVSFYNNKGIKVIRVNGVVKIIDDNATFTQDKLPSYLEKYYEDYSKCYKYCSLLESALTSLETVTECSYFPAIIGRRPNTALNDSPFQGKENVSHMTNGSPIMPSFGDMYSVISTITSRSRKINSMHNSNKVPELTKIDSVEELPSGDIRIKYIDKSVITIRNPQSCNSCDITYETKYGTVTQYNKYHQQTLEKSDLKTKLRQLPMVLEHYVDKTPKGIR